MGSLTILSNLIPPGSCLLPTSHTKISRERAGGNSEQKNLDTIPRNPPYTSSHTISLQRLLPPPLTISIVGAASMLHMSGGRFSAATHWNELTWRSPSSSPLTVRLQSVLRNYRRQWRPAISTGHPICTCAQAHMVGCAGRTGHDGEFHL
jgi:hypothetical protein